MIFESISSYQIINKTSQILSNPKVSSNGALKRVNMQKIIFRVLFNTFRLAEEVKDEPMCVSFGDQKAASLLSQFPQQERIKDLRFKNSLVIFYLFFYEITSKAFS